MMPLRELADGTIIDIPQAEIDADNEKDIRQEKIAAIKVEGVTRLQAHLPNVEDMDDILLLKKLQGAFQPTQAAIDANSVYNYAKGKIADMRTQPIATVQAYDPATDVNWP